MLGELDFSKKEAVVVGAGISGLLIAHRLTELGFRVEIFEASSRLGGMIQTASTAHGISEAAAHSILLNTECRDYLKKIGVGLIALKSEGRARYIFRDQKMRRMPLRAAEILKAFFRAYVMLSNSKKTQSLEDWCLRHLGSAALDYGLNPFIRGVFAARPSELNLEAAFPSLVIRVGQSLLSQFLFHRNKKERAQIYAIEGGTENLVNALKASIESKGGKIHLGRPSSELPQSSNIILSTPPSATASLLEKVDPHSSQSLRKILYSPLISATVFVLQNPKLPKGIGVLVPEKEGGECLGILFNSSAFAGRAKDGFESFTCMFGGTAHPEVLEWSDDRLKTEIQKNLKRLLKVDVLPTGYLIHRWPKAIPIYGDAIQNAWSSLKAGWCAQPGHVVFANYSGKVSIRGMLEELLEI